MGLTIAMNTLKHRIDSQVNIIACPRFDALIIRIIWDDMG